MFLWIIILCGAAFLWHLFQKTKGLDEDLSSALDSVYRQRSELLERIDGLRKELLELRVDVKRGSGDLRITKDTTIAEALMIDSRVKDVLEGFNIGGCSTCSLSDQETLEEAAASYGLNVEEMTAAIERAIGGCEPCDCEPLTAEATAGATEEEPEPPRQDLPLEIVSEEPGPPDQDPQLEIVDEEPYPPKEIVGGESDPPDQNPPFEITEEVEPVTDPDDPEPTIN